LNVAVNADKLNIAKAEKIVIDKKLNTIVVFGSNEFLFKGKMVITSSTKGTPARLEYTLGEDVAYIKSYN